MFIKMGIPNRDITFFDLQSPLTCTDDPNDQPQNKVTLLVVQIGVILFFYLVLLLILCYNLYAFIIGQKRYKVFHLSFFYALAFIILVSRIVFFAIILEFLSQQNPPCTDVPYRIDIVDSFAIFFELALGIQQLFSIIELNLMLQYSWLYKTNDVRTAQKK